MEKIRKGIKNSQKINQKSIKNPSKSAKKHGIFIDTQVDHEANRGPWMSLKNYGINQLI